MKKITLLIFFIIIQSSNLNSYIFKTISKEKITKAYPKYKITCGCYSAEIEIIPKPNNKKILYPMFYACQMPNLENTEVEPKTLNEKDYPKLYAIKELLIRCWLEDRKDNIKIKNRKSMEKYLASFEKKAKEPKFKISKKAFKKYTDIVIRTVV